METPKRKKGGRRRTHVKRPSRGSDAINLEWPRILPSVPQDALSMLPTFQLLLPPAMPIAPPQKSFGELLSELVWEGAKSAWKQTDPASYNFNQTMFALAPYWPPESRWMLGVGAIVSAAYGLGQVADRLEKAIERKTKRG